MTSASNSRGATPLSLPGSPYAFSTALRPTVATGQSHLRPELDVTGRLSLGSVGSDASPLLSSNNLQSPNETTNSESLGLLDLDAMGGDSGVSQFLRSPLNGDRLRLSVTSSDIIVPPSNQTPVFPSAGELDSTGSSENELALSAGDLEQLDVTLSEDFEHTYREDERNGLYNPFEGCEDGGGGGAEFEPRQDQVSFLRQLREQEEELNKATLTPPESMLTSFTSGCPQTDRSPNSYFLEKSNKMGLLSSKLSPSQRPRFNDSVGHRIVSPLITDAVSPALPSTTPFPFAFPPLDLSQTPSLRGGSLGQGLHSMYLRHDSPSFTGHPASFSTQQTPSTSLSQHTPSFSASNKQHTASFSTQQTPPKSFTQHTVGGLPSQYLQMERSALSNSSLGGYSLPLATEDSTLMFPELSAISSLPNHTHYPLATPPSAYLPQGFEVTTFVNQSTTTAEESTFEVDNSHVTSLQDHVTSKGDHVTTINTSAGDTVLSSSFITSPVSSQPNVPTRSPVPNVPTRSPVSSQPNVPTRSPVPNVPTRSPVSSQPNSPTPSSPASSPPSQLHTPTNPSPLCTTTKHSPSPTRSPGGEIPSEWLEVCSCLQFPSAVCVGSGHSEWVELSNKGDRWIQVSLLLTQLTRDEQEEATNSVFTLTQRLFVGPGNKERVKVTFTPLAEGAYRGTVMLKGSLVVSNIEHPLTTMQLSGRGEAPRLCLSPSSLDYGYVVSGAQISLPLELSNSGSCTLPIRVTLNTEDPLHKMYFTVVDTGQATPSSPRSHPHAITLSLPPHPHNKPRPLHLELSAPKLYYRDITRPPLTIKGSLDIAVDSPHTSTTLSSLPVTVVVGVAKLLAPGSFQGDDFTLSCPVGQSKTQRVPLKNAGNIPLTVSVATSLPTLFLVSPHSLQVQADQESYVDVIFAPTSDPGTSEVTLQLHVEPTGPNYNLHMRGMALPVSSGGVALPSEKQRTVSWGDKISEEHGKTSHISQWLSGVSRDQPSHNTPPSQNTHTQESSVRRSVYIREEEVVFPPTPLNTRSTVKVQVCNRDLPLATFTVLKPSPPFTVDHRSFKLASRQCARLPIHFSPALPGKYSTIVALKTESKHQVFVVVRGESPQPVRGTPPKH